MQQKMNRMAPSIIAALISSFGLVAAHAYDDLPRPPPPPAGYVTPPPRTEQSVTQDAELQTARRFAAAAGSANSPLSLQQAKTAGWGFVSDHFKEIDRSGSGYVGLADVLNFMAARTPQQIMRNNANAALNSGR